MPKPYVVSFTQQISTSMFLAACWLCVMAVWDIRKLDGWLRRCIYNFFKINHYTGRSSKQHNKYFTHITTIHTFLDVYCIHALQGGNEYLFIKIHGVTSKKIVTLNIPTVRISNLTHLSLSIFLSSFHTRCNLFNSEGIVKYRAGTRFQFAWLWRCVD